MTTSYKQFVAMQRTSDELDGLYYEYSDLWDGNEPSPLFDEYYSRYQREKAEGRLPETDRLTIAMQTLFMVAVSMIAGGVIMLVLQYVTSIP